ncbi:hypothetical protein [Phenylobacterium soli]|uniref:Uncharacterized protein n=1 Tax=Phenylobacterium soli TaxID=2170551 RepID=A0A328AI98_9CAUL|nr:hypothetical protein [Phenylobacterium soli]RAK54490.1 hypothetical protein DJ017_08125 [Phenylobacterium soli]
MAALSERKIEIVRQIVESAPDRVVGGLEAALSETSEDSALAGVRRLVDAEARDRRLRNGVLQPIAPMCVGDGKDPARLTFPARALAAVWRGLKETAPEAVSDAAVAMIDYRPGESPNEPFDHLVRLAANALRNRASRDFEIAADVCEAARPGGAELFALCLDLSPVVRRALPKLPEWIAHFGKDTTAAAKLAYKDAVAIADDAGPRFFDMLSAQLAHPWMVLRIISAVMTKPTERYLADSEMSGFGQRVMQEIEDTLKAVSKLDPLAGPEAGRVAAKQVELITFLVSEIETCVELSKEHGWGHEITKHRKSLAAVVESHLRSADKFARAALPTQPPKLRRIRRQMPKLNLMPDPVAVKRAITLLTFSHEVRASANYGGFAAARGKLLEGLGEMLDNYVEELLDLLRTGDAEDEGVGYAFMEVAAEISHLVRDERAAELVRRRTAAVRQQSEPYEYRGDEPGDPVRSSRFDGFDEFDAP